MINPNFPAQGEVPWGDKLNAGLDVMVDAINDLIENGGGGGNTIPVDMSGYVTDSELATALSDMNADIIASTETTNTALSNYATSAALVAAVAAEVTRANNAYATPAQIQGILGAAPASLDTLKELADALGNDANFAGTVTSLIAAKAPLVHTHAQSDITGLSTALAGKQPTGDYATNSALTAGLATKQPTGDYSTNTALTSGLAGKANTSHTHVVADITNYVAPVRNTYVQDTNPGLTVPGIWVDTSGGNIKIMIEDGNIT